MKLVIQTQTATQVRNLKEFQLKNTIDNIKLNFKGRVETPLNNELFRYKLQKGAVIIYKNKGIIRKKNTWYEIRVLTLLSKILKTSYYHQLKLELPNGQETEIDGLNTEINKEMVEIKRSIINQDWINYYESKRKKLNMKDCLVVAPVFEENIKIPNHISCFKFMPDLETSQNYYSSEFFIPSWIKSYISSRHIRVFLNTGRWVGLNRKLTQTAKHTPESKLSLFLNNLAKRSKYPIKIYYSLAPMLMPVEEYNGKGRPLSRVIAALDVDSDPHQHIIGKEGYCLECLNNAKAKSNLISERLISLGEKYITLYSGSKGFHIYLLDEDNNDIVKELPELEFRGLINLLKDNSGKPLTDTVNFNSKEGIFDLHRIFKMPNSIDYATGLKVKKNFEKIEHKDKIEAF
ncbi:MAG: hypothetical protein ACFE9Z_08165 [Promethearchaeota archaeon]